MKQEPAQAPNRRQVMSFKAAIVMTQNDGLLPTLASVAAALSKSGLSYVMPASVEGPIVISLDDGRSEKPA